MTNPKRVKVIFDTNIWISFLIGKRLQFIKDLITTQELIVVISNLLLVELKTVTERPKLKKYFPEDKVENLIDFLLTIGEKHDPEVKNFISRDLKDNFLLDLADTSKAHYLVTGDKDLLVLNPFKTTQIISPIEFESELKKDTR
jgi:uncharacterized protein